MKLEKIPTTETTLTLLSEELKRAEGNLKVTYPDAESLYRYILSPDPGLNAWGIVTPTNPKSSESLQAVKTYSQLEAQTHFWTKYRSEVIKSEPEEKSWRQLKPLFQIHADKQAQHNYSIYIEQIRSGKRSQEKTRYFQAIEKEKSRITSNYQKRGISISEEELTKSAETKVKAKFINKSRSSIATREAKKLDRKIKRKIAKENGHIHMKRVLDTYISQQVRSKSALSQYVQPGISRADGKFFSLYLTEVKTWKGANYINPLELEEPSFGLSPRERRGKPVGSVAMCYKVDPDTLEMSVSYQRLEQPGTYAQGFGGAIGPDGQTSVSNFDKAGVPDAPNRDPKLTIDFLLNTAFSKDRKHRKVVEGIVHTIRSGGNPGRIITNIQGGLIDLDAAEKSPHLTQEQKGMLNKRNFFKLADLQKALDTLEGKSGNPITIALYRELLGKAWELQSHIYSQRIQEISK